MFNRAKNESICIFGCSCSAALLGSLYSATGQMINPTVQTASPRVVATRSAPATAGRPVASARVMPQVAARPMGFDPQRLNPNLQRTYAPPSGLPILPSQR